MKTISRYIMTLALLLTAATGAWADSVTMKEITSSDIQSSWNGNTDPVKATDLPGFKAMTHDEAVALGAPSNDEYVFLIYAINANNKFAALFYMSGTKSSSETEFNLNELQSTAQNYWVYYTYSDAPTEPTIEVTTNAASEGATFTEASFNMPAFDATAEYELVRDMTESMTAQVGDGTAGVRYRVQKNAQTSTFQPVGLTNEQVRALFSVNDAIENTTLTQTTDYTVQIFAVNDQDQITGDAMTLANFTFAPGRYIVKAVAAEGSSYCGTTAESNIFVLFQGYEVTVAAGEYVTYYKDEALYTEDEDAKLYTITGVGETTATAARLEVVPALTPILVKNVGDTDQTFLLIPTTTQETVSFHNSFKGTLEATTIAASDDTKNNYAFNGQQFVWVKDAIAIGANKAWLEIPAAAAAARSLSIIFGDATGVRSIDNGQLTIDNWYDLNGRKLQNKPTKKGIYIMNGKKVVVK